MNNYFFPINAAVITFPFLAMIITAPFLIYYYRKYGQLGKLRSLILYSFVFYLLSAYYLVILPLPSIDAVAQMTGPRYELHLFQSWHNFMNQTVLQLNNPSTYLQAMKQSVFLEPVFNIFLLFPFGVYCRYYFKFSLWKTILASFCLSLFFELTQLSGLYFIYPRPYRLFDVNDLFVNTLGGTIGFLVTPLFTFLLPTREEMDAESYAKDNRVTFTRRFVAWLIDWGILNLFAWMLMILLRVTVNKEIDDFTNDYWYFLLEVVLYFILLNYILNGQTLGKKLVRIRVMEENHSRVSFRAIFKRYGLLYLIYVSATRINVLFTPFIQSTNQMLVLVSLLVVLIFGLIQLGFYCNILWAAFKKQPRFFYEKRTATYVVSTIQRNKVRN